MNNNWSCLPRALSALINIPVESIIETIGHDGSEIISTEPSPYNRRGFCVAELIAASYKLNHPLHQLEIKDSDGRLLFNKNQLALIYDRHELLLFGLVNGGPHAVIRRNNWIYDPAGYNYSPQEFDTYIVIERNDQCTKRLLHLCLLQNVVPKTFGGDGDGLTNVK